MRLMPIINCTCLPVFENSYLFVFHITLPKVYFDTHYPINSCKMRFGRLKDLGIWGGVM